jgi:hypothetical protein
VIFIVAVLAASGRSACRLSLGHGVPGALRAINKAKDEGTVAAVRAPSIARRHRQHQLHQGQGPDITKDGDQVEVSFAYEKEFHMFGPAWLTLKYAGQSRPEGSFPPWQTRSRRCRTACSTASRTRGCWRGPHAPQFLGRAQRAARVPGRLRAEPRGRALLYQRLKHLPEGDLSRVRANLVKQDTLHQLAVGLGLPGLLRLGEGEARSGGHKRPSILADALEAVIGAVHLDAGYAAAEALVHRLFSDVEIKPQMSAAAKDPRRSCRNCCRAAR